MNDKRETPAAEFLFYYGIAAYYDAVALHHGLDAVLQGLGSLVCYRTCRNLIEDRQKEGTHEGYANEDTDHILKI